MANNSRKLKIAQEIANLEQKLQENPEKMPEIESQIMSIISRYKLGLGEMMEIDDMIMKMLDNSK